MTVTTKLADALGQGRLALTAECLPPRGADLAAIQKIASALGKGLDAVVVADNPEEVRSSALACAAVLAQQGIEPVLSMVTRDRNRIALESEVLGAAILGVKSFLCLSGDHQSTGVSPQAAGAFDIDSIQLTQSCRKLTDEGLGFDGQKISTPPGCYLGAVAHPYMRPMELGILRLKKKVHAGAKFLLTQAIFDMAGFQEWLTAVKVAGLDKQVAILASVLPLRSVEQAKALAAKQTYGPVPAEVIARLEKASDQAKEGLAICVEIAKKIKAGGGVSGIHVLSGGCEASAAEVIKEAALA